MRPYVTYQQYTHSINYELQTAIISVVTWCSKTDLKKKKTNGQNQLYRVQILLPDDTKHGVKILAFPTV